MKVYVCFFLVLGAVLFADDASAKSLPYQPGDETGIMTCKVPTLTPIKDRQTHRRTFTTTVENNWLLTCAATYMRIKCDTPEHKLEANYYKIATVGDTKMVTVNKLQSDRLYDGCVAQLAVEKPPSLVGKRAVDDGYKLVSNPSEPFKFSTQSALEFTYDKTNDPDYYKLTFNYDDGEYAKYNIKINGASIVEIESSNPKEASIAVDNCKMQKIEIFGKTASTKDDGDLLIDETLWPFTEQLDLKSDNQGIFKQTITMERFEIPTKCTYTSSKVQCNAIKGVGFDDTNSPLEAVLTGLMPKTTYDCVVELTYAEASTTPITINHSFDTKSSIVSSIPDTSTIDVTFENDDVENNEYSEFYAQIDTNDPSDTYKIVSGKNVIEGLSACKEYQVTISGKNSAGKVVKLETTPVIKMKGATVKVDEQTRGTYKYVMKISLEEENDCKIKKATMKCTGYTPFINLDKFKNDKEQIITLTDLKEDVEHICETTVEYENGYETPSISDHTFKTKKNLKISSPDLTKIEVTLDFDGEEAKYTEGVFARVNGVTSTDTKLNSGSTTISITLEACSENTVQIVGKYKNEEGKPEEEIFDEKSDVKTIGASVQIETVTEGTFRHQMEISLKEASKCEIYTVTMLCTEYSSKINLLPFKQNKRAVITLTDLASTQEVECTTKVIYERGFKTPEILPYKFTRKDNLKLDFSDETSSITATLKITTEMNTEYNGGIFARISKNQLNRNDVKLEDGIPTLLATNLKACSNNNVDIIGKYADSSKQEVVFDGKTNFATMGAKPNEITKVKGAFKYDMILSLKQTDCVVTEATIRLHENDTQPQQITFDSANKEAVAKFRNLKPKKDYTCTLEVKYKSNPAKIEQFEYTINTGSALTFAPNAEASQKIDVTLNYDGENNVYKQFYLKYDEDKLRPFSDEKSLILTLDNFISCKESKFELHAEKIAKAGTPELLSIEKHRIGSPPTVVPTIGNFRSGFELVLDESSQSECTIISPSIIKCNNEEAEFTLDESDKKWKANVEDLNMNTMHKCTGTVTYEELELNPVPFEFEIETKNALKITPGNDNKALVELDYDVEKKLFHKFQLQYDKKRAQKEFDTNNKVEVDDLEKCRLYEFIVLGEAKPPGNKALVPLGSVNEMPLVREPKLDNGNVQGIFKQEVSLTKDVCTILDTPKPSITCNDNTAVDFEKDEDNWKATVSKLKPNAEQTCTVAVTFDGASSPTKFDHKILTKSAFEFDYTPSIDSIDVTFTYDGDDIAKKTFTLNYNGKEQDITSGQKVTIKESKIELCKSYTFQVFEGVAKSKTMLTQEDFIWIEAPPKTKVTATPTTSKTELKFNVDFGDLDGYNCDMKTLQIVCEGEKKSDLKDIDKTNTKYDLSVKGLTSNKTYKCTAKVTIGDNEYDAGQKSAKTNNSNAIVVNQSILIGCLAIIYYYFKM